MNQVILPQTRLNGITKTRLYTFDVLKPHFYTVKLGFTVVYINCLFSALKHRLWVLVLSNVFYAHFEKKVCSKRKAIGVIGSKIFPFRVDLFFSEGTLLHDSIRY